MGCLSDLSHLEGDLAGVSKDGHHGVHPREAFPLRRCRRSRKGKMQQVQSQEKQTRLQRQRQRLLLYQQQEVQ